MPLYSAELYVGDVLYCASDYFYGSEKINANSLVRYKTENFKLSVSNNSLRFGSSGYFKNSSMPFRLRNEYQIIAQDDYSTFRIESSFNSDELIFTYASANSFDMGIMKGSCNKF